MLLDIVGFVATFTSIISLPPQIYHTYRSKSSADLSMLMLINFLICSIAWVAYGFLTNTMSVWITNVVMTVFSVLMIGLKIKYSQKKV